MKNNKIDFRNAFFDEMYKISKKNKKIVFLTADISAYSLPKFRKDFPDKFYNVGIAEQGMINIATGLAMNNKKETLMRGKEFSSRLFLGECPPHQATLFKINKKNFKYSTKYYLAADLDFFLKIALSKDIKVWTSKIELVRIGYGGISNKRNLQRTRN